MVTTTILPRGGAGRMPKHQVQMARQFSAPAVSEPASDLIYVNSTASADARLVADPRSAADSGVATASHRAPLIISDSKTRIFKELPTASYATTLPRPLRLPKIANAYWRSTLPDGDRCSQTIVAARDPHRVMSTCKQTPTFAREVTPIL